jgi:DNA-binding NtrC family response regulator
MSAKSSDGRSAAILREDGAKIRVLIIDDEELLRQAMRRVLEFGGFSARDCSSAEEGLSVIPSFRPEVVVTDVRMPKMDGPELLVRIKEAHPEIAVILLSGYIDPDFKQECERMGAFRVMSKPLAVSELEECIRTAVRHAA